MPQPSPDILSEGEIGLDEIMALVEARKRKKGSLGERKEGKGCSDESSARTYGDGAHGLRIPKERPLAPSSSPNYKEKTA